MKYRYFVPFGIVLVVSIFSLFAVQDRIKEDNLKNFEIYQNSISKYISFKTSQYLRGRLTGLLVVSSFDSIEKRDLLKIESDINDYFKYVKEQHVKGIFLYDEDGLIIYSTFKKAMGLNHSREEFFHWCKEGNKKGMFFIYPLVHMDYKRIFPGLNFIPSDLFVLTPVYFQTNGKNLFSGAVAVIIDLRDFIEKELLLLDLREQSEILILWEDGTVIYSRSHPEMVLRFIYHRDCFNCHDLTPFQKAMKEESGGFAFSFKERKITNFHTVQIEDTSFKIFIYTPYGRIVGFVQKSITATLLFTFLLISAFSLSFFMFMRSKAQKLKADEKIESLRTQLKLEEELRKTEEKFRTFGNITSDGIWQYKTKVPIPVDLSVDEQIKMIFEYGYLAWCNDSMAKMYGLNSNEDLIGKPLRDTLNPDDPRNIEFIRAFIQSGYDLRNYESYEKDIYGKTHIFLNSLQGIVKNKNLIEAWGSQKDITEIKEAEEERKKLEEQLFQVQKMEAIGRLTGGVAHDFNNILTAIIGNAEMILSGMSPIDPNYKRMKALLESANRASNLTKKLLTFSRKQLGEPVVVNLNEVIKSLEDMLKRAIGEDISFIISLDENLKPVEIETTLMEQIILNLVVNAREAMPEGGTLKISTRNVVKLGEKCAVCSDGINGEFVELSISDTGVGIPPEIEDKIFEPFYSTKPEGTGLGLSIVYGAVSQMRGHINFKSKVGEGTTFFVYIPVYKGEKKEEFKKIVVGAEEIKGGDETILFVEDEKNILEMMEEFLSELGYKVITASSAEEAMEKIKGISKVDFLITDVILPGKKGPDFAKEMKVIYPKIKVLFVSGYTEDRISAKAVWEGEVNFLSKPFTPFILAKKIREILDR